MDTHNGSPSERESRSRPERKDKAREEVTDILNMLGCQTELLWIWRGPAWWTARPAQSFAPFVILLDDGSYKLTTIPSGKYFEDFPWDDYRQPPDAKPDLF